MKSRPPRPFRNRRSRTGLVALAGLALAGLVSTGPAAASPGNGEMTLSLTANRSQGSLPPQGVKALAVTDLEMLAGATVRTSGTLKLTSKDRAAKLRSLTLQAADGKAAISAKLGKRRLVVFRAEGTAQIDGTSMKLSKAPLSLTGKGARALRKRLGLPDLSPGRLGTVDVDARFGSSPATPSAVTPTASGTQTPIDEQPGLVDPYAQQCALAAEDKATGSAAAAGPAPTLGSSAALSGGKIEWGFSSDFRFYVVVISGGSLVPIAPAEILNPPAPAPQTGTFRFPAGSGAYAINDPGDDGDDQAIVNGEGEVVLCNSPHGFRITLSDPTVILDGEDSRLVVDVDTSISGTWTPTQRVDLATLDLEGADPFYNENAKTVTWAGLPVSLTEAGSEALQLCDPNAPGPCEYEEGDPLDPLTVTAGTATDVAWPFNAACTLASPATASSWPAPPAALLAAPTLTAPEAVSTGAIRWGFRNSLRTTVQNAPGVFNLSGGATRSDAVDMSGAGKFFTWPATGGEYEPGSPGKLVLQGAGTVGLCNTAHGFGTVLSNPTLTIDGAAARLSMDVATRLGVSWTSGRVDLANLAIGGVEVSTTPGPGAGEETITWTFPDPGVDNAPGGGDDDTDSVNSTVKLTAAGGSALSLIGIKNAGTSLNKVAVSIVHPTD